jgi:hypothetical protein
MTFPDFPGLTFPDFPGLSRTFPDFRGLSGTFPDFPVAGSGELTGDPGTVRERDMLPIGGRYLDGAKR